MLEQLFGSQTRVKLMQIFLNNPDQAYFVRELTRMIDSQINAVRRELINMEKIGLIKIVVLSDEEGGKSKNKYFQADTEFILYPELKGVVQKSQFILEQEFSRSLQRVGDIQYLVFTGNFVGQSDIPVDILIVGTIDKKKLGRVIRKYEKEFNREINFTMLDMDEFQYRRNVADKFLYSILDGRKIVMIDSIFNAPDVRL